MAEPIQVQVEADYLIVRCDAPVFTEEFARKFATVLGSQVQSQKRAIFDLRACESMESAALKIFTAPLTGDAIPPGRFAVVGDVAVSKSLAELGLAGLIPCFGAQDQATGHFAVSQKIDYFMNKSVEAVTQVMNAAMGLKAQPGVPYYRRANPELEMAASTRISSRHFEGALTLGFSLKSYLALMSKMFGTPFTEITPEIKDGAAELSNMIVGQVKTAIVDPAFGLKVGTPSSMPGERLRLFFQKFPPLLARPYVAETGEFSLVLSAVPVTTTKA